MTRSPPSPRPPAGGGTLCAEATARALPYDALTRRLESLLLDPAVCVPPRLVQRLAGGGSLFVMPASDETVAITKLITFTPGNSLRGLPSIQGDIVVFDVATGTRTCILDGPTVTARRTAAVSLLAARKLARLNAGRLLIVGAGVQGRAHLEAFSTGLNVTDVLVASRSPASSDALVRYAAELGLAARRVDDPNAVAGECDWIVTATPAAVVSMHAMPRTGAFVAAVGAFTAAMAEWSPDVCRRIAQEGTLVVDTRDADHEAGDLLQAGIDVTRIPTLADVVRESRAPAASTVFFKSCGWAGWDLAAARCVIEGA
jgi:1-piperideine-2-carboxylate/1-pyrroline-2-carboxylate reductase [NAD(P)H]